MGIGVIAIRRSTVIWASQVRIAVDEPQLANYPGAIPCIGGAHKTEPCMHCYIVFLGVFTDRLKRMACDACDKNIRIEIEDSRDRFKRKEIV